MKKYLLISIIGIVLIGLIILGLIGSHPKQSQNNSQSGGENNPAPTTVSQPSSLSPTVPMVTSASEDQAHDLELTHQLQSEPDIYVANHLPYETADIAVSSSFAENPTSHFYFVVTAKNDNTSLAKQKFEQWLLSIGLNQQQISQLDIRYQTE